MILLRFDPRWQAALAVALATLEYGRLVPSASVEKTSTRLRRAASPLFMEECDARELTTVAKLTHPGWVHQPMIRSALATSNEPVNIFQLQ